MIIGIIGAMKEEIAPLLEFFKDYEEINLGNNIYYKVRYKDSIIIIAYSKIGKVHASITATSMILYFNTEKIIFSGVAGAIDKNLKVGDLLIATKLCQHDVDICAFGHPLGFIPEGKLFYESSKTLNAIAQKVADSMTLNLRQGIVASGDLFVAQSEKKMAIKEEFGAIAVEMEGASVACVCDNFNIDFCIFRSISDAADGNAHISFDEFLESSAKISANFVIKMLDILLDS